jgi:uncharacterized membrane protein
MDDIALARALHVVAVVIWLGGMSMVTTVALPALRRGALGPDRLLAFQAIERRFVWQARAAIIVIGLSGLYMIDRLDLWDRFQTVDFWWMHAMVCVWLIFAFMLFIAEPFILHRYIHRWARAEPDMTLRRISHAHWILLGLSLGTVFGAVAGSHGWPIF